MKKFLVSFLKSNNPSAFESKSLVFFVDEGIDSGPIIVQAGNTKQSQIELGYMCVSKVIYQLFTKRLVEI